MGCTQLQTNSDLSDGAQRPSHRDQKLERRVEVQEVAHENERHEVEGVPHWPVLEADVSAAVIPADHDRAEGHVCSDACHDRSAHHPLEHPLSSQRV